MMNNETPPLTEVDGNQIYTSPVEIPSDDDHFLISDSHAKHLGLIDAEGVYKYQVMIGHRKKDYYQVPVALLADSVRNNSEAMGELLFNVIAQLESHVVSNDMYLVLGSLWQLFQDAQQKDAKKMTVGDRENKIESRLEKIGGYNTFLHHQATASIALLNLIRLDRQLQEGLESFNPIDFSQLPSLAEMAFERDLSRLMENLELVIRHASLVAQNAGLFYHNARECFDVISLIPINTLTQKGENPIVVFERSYETANSAYQRLEQQVKQKAERLEVERKSYEQNTENRETVQKLRELWELIRNGWATAA